jgi:hypothetical protein
MKVEILTDIFLDSSIEEEIDSLWHTIEGKHDWIIADLDTYEAIKQSSWYSFISSTRKKAIDDLMSFALQMSKSHQIVISNTSTNHFSIKEAIKYLEQPFSLIIENKLNDAHFFDSLIKHFPELSKKIKKHKEERWFQYDMGGGSTIIQNLRAEMKSFEGAIYKKHSSEYLRCFVLIDSDRRFPNEELKNETKTLVDFLDRCKVPFHILEKREMENYLPIEVFSEINDNNDFVDAFIKLNPFQKDYFDIENGFNVNRFEKLPDAVQFLYNDLGTKEKDIFINKNLKKINGSLEENFKSHFPRLFLSPKVNKENLLARCAHHSNDPNIHPYNPKELPELLTEISRLL